MYFPKSKRLSKEFGVAFDSVSVRFGRGEDFGWDAIRASKSKVQGLI
jgi:hypothetical protein